MSKFKRFALVALISLGLVLGTTSNAFAQTDEDIVAMWFLTTSTTYIGIPLTIVGGVVLTIVLVVGASSEELEEYMDQNAVALQHDLHMGGGESIEDLATMFNVPAEHLDEFAGILYDNRHELSGLVQPGQVDSQTVQDFAEIVVEGMMQNEALAHNLADQLG